MELSLPSQDAFKKGLSSWHQLQGDVAEHWGKEVTANFP